MKSAQQLLVCSLVFAPVAHAQVKDTNSNTLDFGLSADYSSTDNAKRSSAEEIAITETQAIYQASVGARYQNEWSRLISNYEVSKETFDRESQPDATELEGKTELTFGNDYQPMSLSLSHSRIAMLESPEALDLARNRDIQEIVTVAPALKTHFSAADSIMVMGSYSDVSYRKEQQKKSEQQGLQMAWIHGVSKTDTIQITAQHTETSFDFVPQADYQLQGASAQYGVALKRLNYTVQVGYNRAVSNVSDKDFASPTYKIESSYISGAHTFLLALTESITDSSMGSGGPSFGDLASGSGAPAKGVGIDLINVRKASLSWNTSAICERCSFGIDAAQSTQDYKNLREDGDEYSVGTFFKYNFTRAASIDFSLGHQEHKFSADSDRVGFNSDDAKVGVNYSITRDLQLSLYVHQKKRTSVLAVQNYQENLVGLNLSYHF